MHNTETRVNRKRTKGKQNKHEKIVCRVLKKYKVDRYKHPSEHPSRAEPLRLLAYESKNMPLTILAFLEAGNRKLQSWLGTNTAKKLEKEEVVCEKDGGEENVYCECRRPYCAGELMFKCEGFCEGWYHPECMKMKPDEVERQIASNERWYCPSCIYQAQKIVLDTTNRVPTKKLKTNVS